MRISTESSSRYRTLAIPQSISRDSFSPLNDTGEDYTFGSVTLSAGETVTVRNGSGEDTDSTVYTGSTEAFLNNGDPDRVIIANEDGIVLDQESYSAS